MCYYHINSDSPDASLRLYRNSTHVHILCFCVGASHAGGRRPYLNWRHPVVWDGELPGVSGELPVVEQRRVSVIQRGRLPVVCHRRVSVVHRRLSVIRERRLPDVRFDVLPRLHL